MDAWYLAWALVEAVREGGGEGYVGGVGPQRAGEHGVMVGHLAAGRGGGGPQLR